ncbi:MAG: BamA/TamA family outer membrane protein [Elusimicrobiota bacterium]
MGEGTLGFADKFKSRLVIPYMSSPYELSHLAAHEFTHVAQFEVLYGGTWRSPRLIKGLSGLEPLWIMEGMAENIAYDILGEEWNAYDRMILRDAVLYDRLYSFRQLQNFAPLHGDVYLGYKQGHSAMDFLVEKEGREIHYSILKAMRNNLDPLKSFESATTQFKDLHDFNDRWKKWITDRVKEEVKEKDIAGDKYLPIVKDDYNSRNPVYDSYGNFYYVSNRGVKNEIYYRSQERDKKIIPNFFVSKADNLITGDRIYDRIIDYSSESNLLVFAARINQKDYLCLYNSSSGEVKKIDPGLKEICSPAISPDGTMLAFTALDGFNRNIYIHNINSGRTYPLTDDIYPDFGPSFSPSSDKIITASERNYRKDLREIDIQSKEITWLGETGFNDFHPVYLKSGKIIYSSDKNGSINLYAASVDSGERYALTNIESGAFYPGCFGEKILASLYYDGSYKISEIPVEKKFELTKEKREPPKLFDNDYVNKEDLETKRARGRFSTDLFLPSFMYASDVGFIGGGALIMSDYFAYNTVELYGWGWPASYEASIGYVNRKFRPDIFFSLSATGRKFRIIGEEDLFRRDRYMASAGLRYPLTRYNALGSYVHASSREEKNIDENEVRDYESDTGAGITFERNTSLFKPFQAFRGGRLNLGAYFARPLEKEGLDYNHYSLSTARYVPLNKNIVLAGRASLARSEGPDFRVFSLGGRNNLRGYSRESFLGNNAVSLTSEMRFMLFPEINWHISFMWPDINIYSLSASVFSDAGTAFRDKSPAERFDMWGSSWGAGIKLNFYLLQQAPGFLSVQLATPYEKGDKWVTYWTFSAGHVRW